MSREIYELTDETRLVLSHNPQAIAEEMGKHHSFIYDFLEMRKTDVFAQFLPIYNATIRAGAPFCHWDNRMEASRLRYMKVYARHTTFECLREKLSAHNETILKLYEALDDGELSDSEIRTIQGLIQKEIEELMRLNEQLNLQRKD